MVSVFQRYRIVSDDDVRGALERTGRAAVDLSRRAATYVDKI